jgi:hypothetical protein
VPRFSGWLIAVAIHIAVPMAGVLGCSFAEAELPPEPSRGIICVFPSEPLNPLSLAQGATEPEVDALFCVRSTPTPHEQREWCIRYRYAPSLSYTLLFYQGAVSSIWLTEGDDVPDACAGIVAKVKRVQPRSWYPSQAPGYARGCGCSPADTCVGLDAAEQGVEADEAWSTSELRSLTPVFGGPVPRVLELRD